MIKVLKLLLIPAYSASVGAQGIKIPEAQADILYNSCVDCHDSSTKKGGLDLDVIKVDWDNPKTLKHWREVYNRVEQGKMPPENKPQPSNEEKKLLLKWLDQQLMTHSPVGGTPMRRLNRREMLDTLKSIFPIPQLSLPAGFPPDNESHGFDTLGEALVISPSHLAAYRDTGTMIADYLFPQPRVLPKAQNLTFGVKDFTISYSSACEVDGAMRIASKGSITRNGTWLSRFEAPASGKYTISVDASAKVKSKGHVAVLHLQAKPLTGKGKSLRSLGRFPIRVGATRTVKAEVDLFRGETLVFSYDNAALNFENLVEFQNFLRIAFTKDQVLASAWNDLTKEKKEIPRGGIGWQMLKEQMKKQPKGKVTKLELEKLIKNVTKNNISSGETIVFKYFEEGPNIGIHEASIHGPHSLIEDSESISKVKARTAFLGDGFIGEKRELEQFFTSYLTKLFRRPVTKGEIGRYLEIVKNYLDKGLSLNDGLHLAIRTSLLSPHFLYKERGASKQLSQYELAARLSYFISNNRPNEILMSKAKAGVLDHSEVLRSQTLRLLKKHKRKFSKEFTSQWLDTYLLDTLMPDSKLLKKFDNSYRKSLKMEVVKTFEEILNNNLPVIDFIDPGFVYTNPVVGWEIYKLPQYKPKKKKLAKKRKQTEIRRIDIEKGKRNGGLLSMAAVMMATANGVDTQPIIRGVWVLENIIGRKIPEAPEDIPALGPDLSGATTLRERLNAHKSKASCASCHQDIDPVGFVLENFDAVGRWRNVYPSVAKKNGGLMKPLKIDATGVLPTGEKLKDVTDLKRWLVKHPEHFSNCLAEKLMVYATGRAMSYREKRIIEGIVKKNIKQGNRFSDLIVALIDSEIFKAR